MKLLVSVRSVDEARAALEGGADIIDAKEPAHGALGPVAMEVLPAIAREVPLDRPFSVALGEACSARAVTESILALPLRSRGTTYAKIGFDHGVTGLQLRSLLAAAALAAAGHPARPRVIAVAYADHENGNGLAREIRKAAVEAGAGGVLVDTARKHGRTLLDCWSEARLREWVRTVRDEGLMVALAGGLRGEQLSRVAELEPDVIGVRGAACAGGRAGFVEAWRVRELRFALPPGGGTISRTTRLDSVRPLRSHF